MKRRIGWGIALVLLLLLMITIGGSYYMLSYSLSPDPERQDTAQCYKELFSDYPDLRPWVDSLRCLDALRDTMVTMPTGERHHALVIPSDGQRTAVVVHGWRDCSIDFLFLARIYEQAGYRVVLPDLHAHGLSEGDMIQMGWLDSRDIVHWMTIFQTDTMVVHGVSMGAATTMMTSAKALPKGVCDIRFVEDCGYTCVWDEFAGELKNQFGLPEFPLMYSTSMLCRLLNGWSFQEASAIGEVRKSPHPILFIHGGSDTFVPTGMVYRLYDAKPSKKQLWIAEGAEHALSYKTHPQEYTQKIRAYIK